MTIVGDLYSAQPASGQRSGGWLASVWALSAVLRAAGRRPNHPQVLFLGLDLLDELTDRRARCGRVLGLSAREAGPRSAAGSTTSSAGIFTVAIAAIMADLTALSTSGRLRNWASPRWWRWSRWCCSCCRERRSPEPMISRLSSGDAGRSPPLTPLPLLHRHGDDPGSPLFCRCSCRG